MLLHPHPPTPPHSPTHEQLLQDATALAAPWLASCRTAGPTSHTTPTSSPRKPNISSPGGSISSGSASACEVGMYAEQLAAKGYTAWLRTGTAGGCSDYPVMRHTFVVVALPHDAAAGGWPLVYCSRLGVAIVAPDLLLAARSAVQSRGLLSESSHPGSKEGRGHQRIHRTAGCAGCSYCNDAAA
jgi:hypothetical protein